MYYNRCERCGAYLDPGERCDCVEERVREQEMKRKYKVEIYIKEKGTNQYTFNFEGGVA